MDKFQAERQKLYQEFENAEYTLKRSQFLHQHKPVAEADWSAFAVSLGDEFYDKILNSGVAKTLIGSPPRKLRSDMRWTDKRSEPLRNVTELIVEGVCRVRNNSIHGEKFRGKEGQWARDLQLIREAREVLAAAIEWHTRA